MGGSESSRDSSDSSSLPSSGSDSHVFIFLLLSFALCLLFLRAIQLASFMGNPEDPIAGIENIVPSSEYRQPKIRHVTNSSPILDVKSVTLALKCPSCKEPFNVRANLTAVTETTAAASAAATATAAAEMRFNVAGANFPVHENRKLKFDNKTRNKGQLKVVVAAAADRNYTPPESAGKHRRAYDFDSKSAGKRRRAYDSDTDSDSKDDPPSSKKSKVANRHLKFNN
ncbi:unnamed protein product [Fraxinus pennsylvanica]|uniref:Uncharacterized protein n=1 Tax=Fraxinus pennsylvanica TaxID=56036 RepID=A0AAD2E3D9_9LAMI|nr:unnamed protein product [Fraxinus pennsylvanica]